MKPTIGRIVKYIPTDLEKKEMEKADYCNVAEELPAIIVAVWGEDCVNLKVMLDGVGDRWITSTLKGDQPGQWDWFVKE